jgi:hypothetical protein
MAGREGLPSRDEDRGRGGEVGLADLQVQDLLTCRL